MAGDWYSELGGEEIAKWISAMPLFDVDEPSLLVKDAAI